MCVPNFNSVEFLEPILVRIRNRLGVRLRSGSRYAWLVGHRKNPSGKWTPVTCQQGPRGVTPWELLYLNCVSVL